MSYLEQVQKVSDAHYVLPKVDAMRVDVHAFLSEALFAGIAMSAARARCLGRGSGGYPGGPRVRDMQPSG